MADKAEKQEETLDLVEIPESLPATTQDVVQPTPMMLIQDAMANGVAIGDLERLFDLHDRMEKQRQKEAFFRAMANFQAEIPVIVKTKTVDFAAGNSRVTYKYAPMDSIDAQTKQARANNGMSHRFEVDRLEPPEMMVSIIITHVDGHSVTTSIPIEPDTSGSKNKIQSCGSALQYACRYLFTAGYGISTADEDDDGRGRGSDPEPTEVPGDDIDVLREILSKLFHDPAGIMQIKCAGKELEDLSPAQFKNFRNFVNAYRHVIEEKKACDEANCAELYDFYANIHGVDDPQTAKTDLLNQLSASLYYRRKIAAAEAKLDDKIYASIYNNILGPVKAKNLDELNNDRLKALFDDLVKAFKEA